MIKFWYICLCLLCNILSFSYTEDYSEITILEDGGYLSIFYDDEYINVRSVKKGDQFFFVQPFDKYYKVCLWNGEKDLYAIYKNIEDSNIDIYDCLNENILFTIPKNIFYDVSSKYQFEYVGDEYIILKNINCNEIEFYYVIENDIKMDEIPLLEVKKFEENIELNNEIDNSNINFLDIEQEYQNFKNCYLLYDSMFEERIVGAVYSWNQVDVFDKYKGFYNVKINTPIFLYMKIEDINIFSQIVLKDANVHLFPDSSSKIVDFIYKEDSYVSISGIVDDKWVQFKVQLDNNVYIKDEVINEEYQKASLQEFNVIDRFEFAYLDIIKKMENDDFDIFKVISQYRKDFSSNVKIESFINSIYWEYLKKANYSKKYFKVVNADTIDELEASLSTSNLEGGLETIELRKPQLLHVSEMKKSVQISGFLESYISGYNSPGNYVIIDSESNQPQAIICSKIYDLKKYLGKKVSVLGLKKSNNYYALPKYFVLKIFLVDFE